MMLVRLTATRGTVCSVLRLMAVTVAGIVVLDPTIVRAQGTSDAPQPAAGWVFTPSISLGGTWDDNVLLLNPGTNPPSDYGSPIGPSLSLGYTGKRTRFSTGYSGSMMRYVTLDDLNSFQQSLRAMLDYRHSARLSFFAQESFASAPTTDVLQLAGVPFYRTGSRLNATSGGVQAALSKHTSLRSAYTLRSAAFDRDQFSGTQLQGGHSHEVKTTLDRMVSPHLTLGGEYEFTRAIVNSETTSGLPGPQDRFNIQMVSITAQYQAAEGTRLSGGVGVAQLGPGLTHAGRTGPQWHASVSQRLGPAALAASFRQSYVPSFGFGGTMQNRQLMANVRMPLGRTRAYVDGAVSFFDNAPLDTNQPSLQSAWLSTTLGYHATRWLALEGFYGRTQQDSRRAGGQLERNQLGFRMVAVKPIKLN